MFLGGGSKQHVGDCKSWVGETVWCVYGIYCVLYVWYQIFDGIIVCNICNKDILSYILKRKYKEIRMSIASVD